MILILKRCRELREFCGFDKVPDASQFSRFRQRFCNYLEDMFEHLVEMTEPVCRESDEKKADYLIYSASAKADPFLVGIVQLIGVLLADAMHKPQYFKSLRKLIS